jgi:hypothetical protein
LRHFANLGAGFDLVSGGEIRRVLAAGSDIKTSVFAGVGKTEPEIELALANGIFSFHVESEPELARINHVETFGALACERAFLAELDGSCKTPIAGHALIEGEAINFRGLIARPDGRAAHDIAASGRRTDAAEIGAEAGRELKRLAGPGFFD